MIRIRILRRADSYICRMYVLRCSSCSFTIVRKIYNRIASLNFYFLRVCDELLLNVDCRNSTIYCVYKENILFLQERYMYKCKNIFLIFVLLANQQICDLVYIKMFISLLGLINIETETDFISKQMKNLLKVKTKRSVHYFQSDAHCTSFSIPFPRILQNVHCMVQLFVYVRIQSIWHTIAQVNKTEHVLQRNFTNFMHNCTVHTYGLSIFNISLALFT